MSSSRLALIAPLLLLIAGSEASTSRATTGFGGYLRELAANDPADFDEFGYSVAIDGGFALVASEDDDDAGLSSGSAYLFDVATGLQLQKFVAADAAAGDGLGFSSALSMPAGVAALGAPQWIRSGKRTGAAYLFNASTGAQIARLNANDGAQGDEFGVSMAIDAGRVIVGARMENSVREDSGSAYIFDAATGQQLRKLKANDAGLNDQFGTSVDIDGSLALVGAYLDDGGRGSAYIFDIGSGTQLQKLVPTDELGRTQFGISVAIDNGIALVGTRGARPDGTSTGAAYLFDVATGDQLAQLLPADGASSDNFGFAVAIDNGLAVIGAMEHGQNGAQSGAAYVFDVATHQQLAKIWPGDGAAGDRFGWAVSIDNTPTANGRVLVGARYGDAGAVDSGSAYLFDVSRVPEPNSVSLAGCALVLGAARTRGSATRRSGAASQSLGS